MLLQSYDYVNYTPEMIRSSVKLLDNDVIEVRRNLDGQLRQVWCFVFIMILFVGLATVPRGTIGFFFPEMVVKVGYSYQDWVQEREKQAQANAQEDGASEKVYTYDDFLVVKRRELAREVNYAKPLLFTLCVFLVLLALPKSRPVRIDRKRGLVYFWSWNRFFIRRLPQHINTFSEIGLGIHTHISGRHGFSCITISIPHESQSKETKVWIGTPSMIYDKYALASFILDYLQGKYVTQGTDVFLQSKTPRTQPYFSVAFLHDTFGKMIDGFANVSFLPSLGYSKKRTEKHIAAWEKCKKSNALYES